MTSFFSSTALDRCCRATAVQQGSTRSPGVHDPWTPGIVENPVFFNDSRAGVHQPGGEGVASIYYVYRHSNVFLDPIYLTHLSKTSDPAL